MYGCSGTASTLMNQLRFVRGHSLIFCSVFYNQFGVVVLAWWLKHMFTCACHNRIAGYFRGRKILRNEFLQLHENIIREKNIREKRFTKPTIAVIHDIIFREMH